jgi:SPP1 gp7 family putative phage head morphogenesis protein
VGELEVLQQKTQDWAQLSKQQLRRLARERFKKIRKAERSYRSQLQKLGANVGSIIHKYAPTGNVAGHMTSIRKALEEYARAIRPWAHSITEKMHSEVKQRDGKAWIELSREMGQHLTREINSVQMQRELDALMDEQVDLITSIPVDASARVHKLALKSASGAMRPEAIAKEIAKSGDVSISKAREIARTEVSRTQTMITQVRAKRLGSEGYIWRTSGDEDVRPALSLPAKERASFKGSHRKLEGTFHRWDKPPISGQKGERAHPGCIYNCRCWAEPVLPDRIT